MLKRVIVRGPALSQSGYGEHTRFVLRALQSRPDLFDIYLVNINWGETSWVWEDNVERQWIDFLLQKTIQYTPDQNKPFDVSIQVTIPNEWEKMAPINIGVTAGIETTKIAPSWIEKALQMNRIIVVSKHAKYGFENTEYPAKNGLTGEDFMAKVTCPVEVVGYPAKNIEPSPISLDLKYDFNFLTVGTWIVRKNLENTIKWFVEEFYDQEVGLVVKTSMAKNCLQDREACFHRLKELLQEYKDRKCEVSLLHGDMSEGEMTALYQHPKIKSVVSISHGEGFGLPLFEAAYNALPVVATDWSGHTDFLYMSTKNKKGKITKKPMFSRISYDILPVQPSAVWDGVIQKDSMWAFPKEWDYKKTIRSVVKNYGTVKSTARKLQKYLVENYSTEKQNEKFIDFISLDLAFDNGKTSDNVEQWFKELTEDTVQEFR